VASTNPRQTHVSPRKTKARSPFLERNFCNWRVNTDPQTGEKLSETYFQYNVQGRLSQADVNADGDDTIDSTSEYVYDATGIRVGQTVDDVTTRYLFDHHNPTGYEQVLEERDSNGQLIRSYTLGLDVIAQAEASDDVYHFLYDGHGSTRALTGGEEGTGLIAVVDSVVQRFSYDAYGNPLGFDPTTAATAILYSGEWFQIDIQQQYLRARLYDPATGTFNRLDPFAGNVHDPQSLHKYLYVHGDPVNNVDPTGQFATLIGGFGAFALGRKLNLSYGKTAVAVGFGTVTGLVVDILYDPLFQFVKYLRWTAQPVRSLNADEKAVLSFLHNSTSPSIPAGDVTAALDAVELWTYDDFGAATWLSSTKWIAGVALGYNRMAAITLGREINFASAYDPSQPWVPDKATGTPSYELLAHETVHSVQVYRSPLGYTSFIPHYLLESGRFGYEGTIQEIEAYAMSHAVQQMINNYGSGVIAQILAGTQPATLAADLNTWYTTEEARLRVVHGR